MKMNQPIDSQPAVTPATLEQRPILANLLELYTHDFCDFLELELQPDGRFGYIHLDLYWTDPDRHPFLIRVDEKLAGFVLVRRIRVESHPDPLWDMTEFFILRGHRNRGIGTAVAHKVWNQFPARWQVRVMAHNVRAIRFWEHAVTTYTAQSTHSSPDPAGKPDAEGGGGLNPRIKPHESTRASAPEGQWHIFSFRSGPDIQTHPADQTGK
jgi:predicted acetyltransferase